MNGIFAKPLRLNLSLCVVLTSLSFVSCMDQYNPRPYWKQFTHERQLTSASTSALTEKGELPVKTESNAAAQDPVSVKFSTLCSSCHGVDGKADGAAAIAMNPKPRNFHDKDWQAKVTDEHISNVIKNGGASVGLSATMSAWGALLTEEEVKGIVGKIREWGK